MTDNPKVDEKTPEAVAETPEVIADLKTLREFIEKDIAKLELEERHIFAKLDADYHVLRENLIQQFHSQLQNFISNANENLGKKRGQLEQTREYQEKLTGIKSMEPLPEPLRLVDKPMPTQAEETIEKAIAEILHGPNGRAELLSDISRTDGTEA